VAIAEYDVVINRDAMSVYDFLLDARNMPSWRAGVRSIELESGAAGTKGAVYRQTVTGPGGRAVCGDIEITEARPGAEIQYRIVGGPESTRGGFYLSTEGGGTRVRFAVEREPRGVLARLKSPFRRRMKAEVCQLEQLKSVLEDQTGP
jgi:uncharacterized membrane protein